jgi:hypothetical protein
LEAENGRLRATVEERDRTIAAQTQEVELKEDNRAALAAPYRKGSQEMDELQELVSLLGKRTGEAQAEAAGCRGTDSDAT